MHYEGEASQRSSREKRREELSSTDVCLSVTFSFEMPLLLLIAERAHQPVSLYALYTAYK